MAQFQSKKKKSTGISGRCIARIAAVLWGVGLSVCGFLIISHAHQAVKSSVKQPSHLPGLPMSGKNKETPEQEAQRFKASGGQQAWLMRKYKMMNKLGTVGQQGQQQVQPQQGAQVDQDQSPPQQQQGKRVPFLPAWLLGGDQKKAINGDANNQFIEPACREFKHDILKPTHGCQVNRDLFMVFCQFQNMRIDVSKIKSDRGGELLESVMGRHEQAEFPVYEDGAFWTSKKPVYEVPMEYRSHLHYMENVLNNMKYPKKNNEKKDMECTETWSGTTMFITRYEYVNLYHTMTDWWNAYFVMPPEDTNIRVVFLDGHAKGNLDPAWEQMFGKVTYVQHLPKGGVCFEKAVFIPAGYGSALFPNMDMRLHCPRQKLADEFSNHVLKSFNLQNAQRIPGKIVIIDRKPYISHPRSKPENAKRILTNLDELRQRLLKMRRVTSVELLRLESMSFGEQLSAIRDAHILIGNHGAGLSHSLFMDRKSDVLEFTIDYMDFFIYLCEWKGVQHTPIPIAENRMLSASEIGRTANIVESILG